MHDSASSFTINGFTRRPRLAVKRREDVLHFVEEPCVRTRQPCSTVGSLCSVVAAEVITREAAQAQKHSLQKLLVLALTNVLLEISDVSPLRQVVVAALRTRAVLGLDQETGISSSTDWRA